MANQLILAPPIAFLVFVVFGVALNRIGDVIADGRSGQGTFRRAYACGEDLVGSRTQPSYKLYHVGVGFTIIHLVVLLYATMPTNGIDGTVGLGLTLLVVLSLSLFAMLRKGLEP